MELRIALRQLSRGSYGTVRNLGEENFLRKHQDLFCMQSNGYIVDAIFPVHFCKRALEPNGCPAHTCPDLHLCPFHLLDKCKHGSSDCKRSHDPEDNHTQRILRDRLRLGHLSQSQKRSLLKKLAEDRRSEWETPCNIVPKVCTYYNTQVACRKGSKCSYLHVCRHWINGTCKFGGGCKRAHDFESAQNRDILERDGLHGLPDSELLKRL